VISLRHAEKPKVSSTEDTENGISFGSAAARACGSIVRSPLVPKVTPKLRMTTEDLQPSPIILSFA
jgi:hypothetical protein